MCFNDIYIQCLSITNVFLEKWLLGESPIKYIFKKHRKGIS